MDDRLPLLSLGRSTSAQVENKYFSIDVIAKKSQLYQAVKEIRAVGGSGVLVKPLTYIFDEEPPRWAKLIEELGLNRQHQE